jgi:ABC-type multidrug transport system ATPase subunit
MLGEVSEVADDVVVIANGSFVVHSPVQELVARSDRVRVTTPGASQLQALLTGAGLGSELIAPDSLLVSGSREQVGGIAAGAGIPIYGLDIDAANLEEIFLELTGTAEGRN